MTVKHFYTMRTYLDELLEMETPTIQKKSCGCGCPSCSGKAEKEWNELANEDELSSSQTSSAVAYNRDKATSLGWGNHRYDIVEKVLRLNYSPDEQTFASLVAQWQASKGLTADGKLGPSTWEAMKPILGIRPSTSGSTAPGPPANGIYEARSCPVNNPGMAKDRCNTPGVLPCPRIPNLLCMRGVDNVPFEYVHSVYRDPQSGLERVKNGEKYREQKFVPATRQALIDFKNNMARFGMPIHTILTLGSLYCRCVSSTQSLSNHSYGEAIDVAGVRWKSPHPFSRVEDTVVRERNLYDPEQVRLFRRINACLRLSFKNVIDYHRSDHRDHFHCDLNRGGRDNPIPTIKFAQECLSLVLGRKISVTGTMDSATYQALAEFSGLSTDALRNIQTLHGVYRSLFERIASGRF